MSIVIAGQHLIEKKHVWVSLTGIFGVGKSVAMKLCEDTDINPHVRLSTLTEADLDKLRGAIGELKVEGDLRREIAINIKRMMDMGSYVGIRHRRGLPVNGQRTKTNARTRKGRRKKKD